MQQMGFGFDMEVETLALSISVSIAQPSTLRSDDENDISFDIVAFGLLQIIIIVLPPWMLMQWQIHLQAKLNVLKIQRKMWVHIIFITWIFMICARQSKIHNKMMP